jgi:hypothetical protein
LNKSFLVAAAVALTEVKFLKKPGEESQGHHFRFPLRLQVDCYRP